MVFVRTPKTGVESYNIRHTIVPKARHIAVGDVGIEIEVEGKKLPKEDYVPLPWVYHHDGSLRGADNAEYVLAKPLEFKDVDKALDNLWDLFRKKGSVLDESNRTSVHIHLNVQDFYLDRVTSLMALYFAFEEILTAWCGEHRVGNLFCLRAKDAPAIISQIRNFIRSTMGSPLKDNLHYAGLNANALYKFGSLEFRSLRGVSDPGVIKQWIAILRRLYDVSKELNDPRDVCGMFSATGPVGFLHEILGPQAEIVRAGINMSDDDISHSLYEGIRIAQDLAYARDWSEYKGVEYKEDPFGRKKKTGPGFSPEGIEAALQEMYALNGGAPVLTVGNQNPFGGLTGNGLGQTVQITPVIPTEPEADYYEEWNQAEYFED